MSAIVDTEPTEREQIITALMEHNRTAKRLPVHYVEQKKRIHAQMNDLITLLELTP